MGEARALPPEIVDAINDAFADDLCSTEAALAVERGYYVEEFQRISGMLSDHDQERRVSFLERLKHLFWS
jgi:hypothetical protein